MTARDELAREIFLTDNHKHRDQAAKEWDAGEHPEYVYGIADGLIAAGWTRPRTITTVAELDALPMGSKVVSAGYEWTKNYQTNHAPGYEAEREVWFNVYDDFDTSEDLTLPAAVLPEPTP